jgi:hypothetical protein
VLARRHGREIDAERFLDDVARIPTIKAWGVGVDDVRPRVRPGMATGDAIASIFEAYAERQGKPRWGDKTPMYMRHLPLLERLFPEAQYVHLVRDGRDAAPSFLEMPEGTFTRTWAHPATPAQFACLWRKEVAAARALGARVGGARYHEVRYEDLVVDPTSAVATICSFAAIPFEPDMLAYAGTVDVSDKPHQLRLRRPPTPGVRSWREDMSASDIAAFESVAGDLLEELGYEVTSSRSNARASAARAWYDTRVAAWNASASLVQRSPLWRRRHPRLSP